MELRGSSLAQWAIGACGLVLALALAVSAAGPAAPPAYDGHGADPAGEKIEWKESWEATYKANVARWEAEVRKLTPHDGERAVLVRTRAARLLEALLARYPGEAGRRPEALKEIAGNYYACGLVSRGNHALRRLVEEAPGSVELTASALHRILVETGLERPGQSEGWAEWLDYAAARLVAMSRAGGIADSHPATLAAWRALLMARRAQGRFLEAAEALEAIEAATGRNDAWLHEEAELLYAAGREQDALARFQELFGRSEQNHRARDRISHIQAHPPAAPPAYAAKFGLEFKWDAIRTSPPGEVADRIGEVLREDAGGRTIFPWKDVRQASLWVQLDRHLLAQPPEALAPLRAAQEAQASRAARPDRSLPAQEALRLYRRHPWAATAQRALLLYGEEHLRAGRSGLALRAFQDALAHAAEPGLRAAAEKGIRLASAAPAPAAQEAPALSALERRLVRLPPVGLWQPELFERSFPNELIEGVWPRLVEAQAHAGGLLVAGPELLAMFGDDPHRPLWTRTRSGEKGKQGRLDVSDHRIVVVPGAFRPAIADGRVYSRWGLDPTRRFLTDLAAFDARSGELLWSTATEPGWDGLWPVGDPAAADGRLYVLAMRKGYAGILPVSTISLACLDAATGAVLWRQMLASQNVALIPGQHSSWREWQFDLAHYGNAVTVADGAVYCQTNLGFVARCDARDGQVEWAANYPQVDLRNNVPRVLRRRGSAPIVCGERVVFIPRDAVGAFALDAASGKLLWDNPFAPSDEAVGLHDGLVMLADRESAAAFDVASGRPRWRRWFPSGLDAAPMLRGGALYIAAGGGLERLDAATGRTIEAGEMPEARGHGPLAALAISGRALHCIAHGSLGDPAAPVGKPLNPQPKVAQGPLRLPMARCWTLPRPNPTLWAPPPEARLEGKLFLLSQGVLECVRATPQGGVDWQRGIRPGHIGSLWAEGALLLIYPASVAALDTASGRLLWETRLPFAVRQWQEAGQCLALGGFSEAQRGRTACALDVRSGKLLWHREFRELGAGYDDWFHGIGWDGQRVHFLATLSQRLGGGHFQVLCDPADGRIAELRPFLPRGRPWPAIFEVGDSSGFYIDQEKTAWDFALDGSPHTRYAANLRDLDAQHERFLRRTRTRRRLEASEQWIQIQQQEGYPTFRHSHWILQRGNPAYELRRPRPGTIRGSTLYELDEQSLRIVDLPSRKEVALLRLELPSSRRARILDWQEADGTLIVVSGIERGPYASAMKPYRVQLDAFERASGRHLARQLLEDVPYWRHTLYYDWREHLVNETQAAWAGNMLFLADADGLIALAPAPAGEGAEGERRVHIAHLAPRPPAIDGWLDDWPPKQAIPVQAEGGTRGELHLAHDAASLFLALALPTRSAAARRGGGQYADGDWLDLALAAGEGTHRLAIGADPAGGPAIERTAGADGARGAIRHDPLASQLVYELSLPLERIVQLGDGARWRRLQISIAAWQTPPGGQPRRILSWGSPWWADAVIPEFHQALYLHPLTREGEDVGLAVARELPELDEAWDFFQESAELRARGRPSRIVAQRYLDYLKLHPSGLAAERAIVALDRALRAGLDSDPVPEVLRLAQEARVPESIRSRYARLARSYLSLWLHTDPTRLPAALMLQVHDGSERGGWDHRVAWGVDQWRDWGELGTPSRQHAGPIPQADGWQELRIPLIWLDMHDKPICGLSFMQFGGGRLVWDRIAVVHHAGERVIIEGEPPKARELTGQWAWVTEPRRGAPRTHTDANPGGASDTARRDILGLDPPVHEHVIPPDSSPVLSQWVYLDPDRPPRTIALNLQARGDPVRFLWGRPAIEGRYMGPLPKPGQWHELRIPLAWTPYAAWPLKGLLFEDIGGRAYWDRTALVRDAKEQVVIEDAMPEGSARNDWLWVEQPAKSGKRAHTHAPGEGYEAHGVLYLREPWTHHLQADPVRLRLALQDAIPKLGPTEPAWRFFAVAREAHPYTATTALDRTRWFLNSLPDHPRNLSLLKSLLDRFQDSNDPAPLASVEKIMEEAALPRHVRVAFRRQFGSHLPSFIRSWRVLGPFPNPNGAGHSTAYPPETGPVALEKDYETVGGNARWRLHRSETDYVNLAPLFVPNQHVVAYAAVWLRSPRAQPVSLEVGSDDGVKLWLNRRLLLDHREARASAPRQHSLPAELRAGWNELLLKIEQGTSEWGFHLEVLDPEARGLLPQLTLATSPPPK